ncbi:hypothetical protein H9P43_009974 [Blastocladiella emersonii ATCC 22665]|nr:hypothetical protein H9P43_009974 [Blastocladiella emersonii ATCC 22665]
MSSSSSAPIVLSATYARVPSASSPESPYRTPLASVDVAPAVSADIKDVMKGYPAALLELQNQVNAALTARLHLDGPAAKGAAAAKDDEEDEESELDEDDDKDDDATLPASAAVAPPAAAAPAEGSAKRARTTV